jgi:glucose-6-phosphate 1-dehydrogenase
MDVNIDLEPIQLVIFGAGGNLTWRKLMPVLYNLFLGEWLPDRFAVIGVDRKAMSDIEFRQHLHQGGDRFSRCGNADDEAWHAFAQHLAFISADVADSAAYAALADRLSAQDKKRDMAANRIFYLATPPTIVEIVAHQLANARLVDDRERARLVAEKPFGYDLVSARALNRALTGLFPEGQVYRIDHYLGKETVRNILTFRFANALFEPIWDRRYIDHV